MENHTPNRLETCWKEARPFIKKTWPRFTDVELDRINGNFDKFLFYLNEFYNNFPLTEALARDTLQKFLNEIEA